MGDLSCRLGQDFPHLLFLLIMVGLWIWESSWPDLVRLVGFAGIVVWTLLAVYSLIRDFR